MDIVKEKEFIELTATERAELGELCSSEDEFNQVKAMFAGIGAMDWSNPAPKAETKESLDHLFAQKYPKAAPVWYNAPLAVVAPKGKPFYRQPLVQAAAVGLLIFLAYPFIGSNVMTSDNSQVAVLEQENTTSEQNKNDVKPEENLNESPEMDGKEQVKSTVETRRELFEKEEVLTEAMSPSVASSPVSSKPTRSVDLFAGISAQGNELKDSQASGSGGDLASQPGSNHPDGIFIGDEKEIFSVPASREPAVFDLLTSTF